MHQPNLRNLLTELNISLEWDLDFAVTVVILFVSPCKKIKF